MSENSKAVFLSYASQDAEAARRICDTLRTEGVEVWFDADGGLEHGDEWDAKIRRQIKECVLFIPLISANTQAREEGYFRLEWDLAAERARTIASGVPFILPVVIDDTREPDALVPDRFRMVQWTKLPGGVVTPEVKARYLKLWSHRTGALKTEGREPRAEDRTFTFEVRRTLRGRLIWLSGAAVAVVLLGALGHKFLQRNRPTTQLPSTASAPLTEARRLASHARSLIEYIDNATREELTLADQLCEQALKLDATDAEVWATASEVSVSFIPNYFDRSPARHAKALQQAQRAVALAPDLPYAQFALANYYRLQATTRPQALQILTALVERDPTNKLYLRRMGNCYRDARDFARAIEFFDRAAALPGGDVTAIFNRGQALLFMGRREEAEAAIDHSLAIKTMAQVQLHKLMILLFRGDLDASQKLLSTVAGSWLLEDRWAYFASLLWIWSDQPERALDVLRALPRDYLESAFTGPKAFLTGLAQVAANRPEVARADFELALQKVEQRLAAQPADAELLRWKAHLLAQLQRTVEAERVLVTFDSRIPDLFFSRSYTERSLSAVTAALLGHDDKAVALIQAELDRISDFYPFNSFVLRHDPIWAPLRNNPNVQALAGATEAKEKVKPSARQTPDLGNAKSVAVLPFANQSADKDNEYFSDGIAEELLMTLQKIPGLRVAARPSAWSFKGKNPTAREVGEMLGMAHVVEGSVQKNGNRVQITARLSRAATNEAVWSKSYGPLELTDVFATQSEIATAIVAELRGQLTGEAAKAEVVAQVQAAELGATKNVEAHQLYLQGRFFVNQHTVESAIRAAGLLRRAVELDPQFALAWAALSDAGRIRSGFGDTKLDFDEGLKVAREAADRALALAPNLVPALLARENLLRTYEFDWKRAAESLRHAKALAPSDPAVLTQSSELAFAMGQVERAVELGKEAAALDPVNPRLRMNLGYALTELGRYDEAKAEFQRIIELSPTAPWGYSGIGLMLTAQGKAAEAVAAAAKVATKWERLYVLAIAEWARGNKVASDAALNELIASDAEIAAVQIAWACAYRRETDRAFEWLERAYRQHDGGLAWTKANFALQSLHSDPRWPAFWTKFGLTNEPSR